ncbi:MAG: hypothetical protein ACOCWG_01445 [bacterium]
MKTKGRKRRYSGIRIEELEKEMLNKLRESPDNKMYKQSLSSGCKDIHFQKEALLNLKKNKKIKETGIFGNYWLLCKPK